jgi:curved DNA-binding protein CbpA
MAVKKSLYQLLEVSPAASEEVIRAAYAARIARLTESADPDGRDRHAARRAEVLCDPARRKQYDERLREELRRTIASSMDEPRPQPASARASPPSAPAKSLPA